MANEVSMENEKSGVFYTAIDETSSHPHDRPASLFRRAWRSTTLLGACAALCVLIINAAVLGWTVSKFELQSGIAFAYEGSCSTSATISRWVHLAINILSSVLLAASNSAMQILVAPTRQDIDRAHSKKKRLDIGVHTMRNLFSIGGGRLLMWLSLGLSSVPLHLLYNSVVFEITSGNGFLVATVGKNFVTGGFWNHTRADNCFLDSVSSSVIQGLQQNVGSLVRLTNAECISTFGAGTQSAYGNLLAVSTQSVDENLLNAISVSGGGGGVGNNWVCDVAGRGTQYCDLASMVSAPSSWTLPGSAGNANLSAAYNFGYYCSLTAPKMNYPIDYCLAQAAPDHCKLGISAIFLGIVVACNLFKTVCLFITVFRSKHSPLVTIGDAIVSFLDQPDPSTSGQCLLSRKDAGFRNPGSAKPMAWKRRRCNGWSAASTGRWIICSLLFVAMWALCAGLLNSGITTLKGIDVPTSVTYLKYLGFGKPILNAVLTFPGSGLSSLPADVMIANLPQLAVSLLYLLYNDLFTRMYLMKEWLSYGRGDHKPLRVTWPTGEQRSTYFLQLPFVYSIPLLVVMIVMHWLISQSIFITLINLYDYSQGTAVDRGLSTSGLGWSPYAIVFSLAVGGLMILFLWAFALFPRSSPLMPIAGSSSTAISAACHPLATDVNAARKLVRWGVVSRDPVTGIGHASFTSGEAGDVRPGELYM